MAETATLIAGNEVDLNDPCLVNGLYYHAVLHCMYLVLAVDHETSHVHFLSVHMPTTNVMRMQLERTPN